MYIRTCVYFIEHDKVVAIIKKMHKIKYHPVKNNDDDQLVHESNLNQNEFTCHVQKLKIPRLLRILLIGFIIIKLVYMAINFKTDVRISIENITILCDHRKSSNITCSLDKMFSSNTSTTNLVMEVSATTAVAAGNYKTNLKKKKKNIFTRNNADDDESTTDYFNVDLTTTGIINGSKPDLKIITTTRTNTININRNNVNKTTTEICNKNETFVQNVKTIANSTAANITIPTTTIMKIKPMTTASSIKAPAADKQKYFLNTSHCHIPFVEPFTPDILKIFKPQHSTGCTNDHPIVTVSFNELEAHYILHINYTVAEGLKKSKKNYKHVEEDVICCYQQIVRSGSGSNVDNSFKLLPCTNFHQDFVVPVHVNGIIVNCKSKSEKSSLQEDTFSFIQVNKTLMQQDNKNITSKHPKISILMIGIDTLSRINFRRNMPEMFKYLVDNDWYELMGYNKVGDNTLPNLMPLLSGYTKHTVYDKCHPNKVGGFDNCNFMWTTFRNHSYHTAYAEDSIYITTFTYHLKGFNKPPTDYYFRPMALAIEKSMKKKVKSGLNYCIGRKQSGEYIYDYATEFVTRYKNLPSFGFFWTNSFSHNSYDISATMDITMLKYFKEWKNRGIFEKSVVIFFSDHGARWGPLLKLSQGFLENRLPMFFISVPKWFRESYPQLVKNLEINQKRLTNPFDIHMTLQHLLKLSDPTYSEQQALDCPKCQSIFKEIPESRTCEDASIPKAWCTCLPFRIEPTKSETVQTITELIIQEMNNYNKLKNLSSLCSSLRLDEITKAKLFYPDDLKLSNNVMTYAIDFVTNPITKPKTLFSATVDYDVNNKRIHLNVEDISRQSLYENTAKCTDDKQAKKYCICKNSLK